VSQLKVDRPLSPHLSIYRPMLTMMMSIAHRITGAALYFGMLLVAWWLMAAAGGPNAYARFQWFIGSWSGMLLLFGFTWALICTTCAGRHPPPDLGSRLRLRPGRTRMAHARDADRFDRR
jgi:succinate dehydrogenase cytochrome b556 subunit